MVRSCQGSGLKRPTMAAVAALRRLISSRRFSPRSITRTCFRNSSPSASRPRLQKAAWYRAT